MDYTKKQTNKQKQKNGKSINHNMDVLGMFARFEISSLFKILFQRQHLGFGVVDKKINEAVSTNDKSGILLVATEWASLKVIKEFRGEDVTIMIMLKLWVFLKLLGTKYLKKNSQKMVL